MNVDIFYPTIGKCSVKNEAIATLRKKNAVFKGIQRFVIREVAQTIRWLICAVNMSGSYRSFTFFEHIHID